MWIFIVSLLLIKSVITFLIFHKWRITITFYCGELVVKVGAFKVFSSADKKKFKKSKPKKQVKFEHIKEAFEETHEVYKEEKHEIISLLQETSRQLDYRLFSVSINFGFGDAAITGIANGVVWSGITGVVAFLKKYIDLENKTNIALYPKYTETCFDIDACLILETRITRFLRIVPRIKRLYDRNKDKITNLRMVVS